MKRSNKTIPYSVSRWLLPVVFGMQLIVSFVIKWFSEFIGLNPDEYSYIVLTQLFSVILPCLFLCLYSGASFKKSAGIKKLRLNKAVKCIGFGFFIQPVAILAGIPLQRFINVEGAVVSPPDNINDVLIMILVVCILPAFCEEMLVRGFLLNSIKRKGYVFAIFVTTVMFVILHGNMYSIFGYAILGIATAFAVLNTNSVFAGVLVHLAFNFCGVVLDYIVNLLYSPGGFVGTLEFYIFTGAVSFVLSIIFASGVYTKKVKKYPTTDFFRNFAEVFVNLPVIATLIMYVLYVVM